MFHDLNHHFLNHHLLPSLESWRLQTYRDFLFLLGVSEKVVRQLAKAGFYCPSKSNMIKCFSCDSEHDITTIKLDEEYLKLHKNDCGFNERIKLNGQPSKKFLSYDSLKYEKERLHTFIEWPIHWISPEQLAADGFYYLREHDNCACIFCNGIVGGWEKEDTVRGEHKKHFPNCPFITGRAVGNLPLSHSAILDKLVLDREESPRPSSSIRFTPNGGRLMSGSYAECNPPKLGLHPYSGPKKKMYNTTEIRLKTFDRFPRRRPFLRRSM